jgi:predicted secreted protein
MKRTLIALVLALGATAAVADPTLNAAQNQQQSGWRNAPEVTAYQGGSIVESYAPDYSFNP